MTPTIAMETPIASTQMVVSHVPVLLDGTETVPIVMVNIYDSLLSKVLSIFEFLYFLDC